MLGVTSRKVCHGQSLEQTLWQRLNSKYSCVAIFFLKREMSSVAGIEQFSTLMTSAGVTHDETLTI